jgi:GNAT superfamily N-acetyltransferase
MDNSQYSLRMALAEDGHTIARHRAAMFREMGLLDEHEASDLQIASAAWLTRLLTADGYIGWLVEHDGHCVAGAGVILREQGPSPGCLHVAQWAHIVNVYTESQHRRRGLARWLMQTILNWCEVNVVEHVTLAASPEGRPLYESLGFKPTADMKLAGLARI